MCIYHIICWICCCCFYSVITPQGCDNKGQEEQWFPTTRHQYQLVFRGDTEMTQILTKDR